ncbi:MAG TPA: ATP synthase F1 subunit delta [Flavobacteriaceae bacterium]|nr:ATP synthase F1 subunit delta [Flavobacteriaceae bacterium]
MGSRAAQRYAKAVLSLAQDQNKTEAVNVEMMLVSNTLADNENLLGVLKSPAVNPEAKRKSLHAIFKETGKITQSLFDILLDNKRIDILDEVAKKYISLYNETNNIRTAVVTTAVPLTSEMEQKVLAKVKELTGGDASLKNEIDENILGGFILRVGDLQYNASVAGNLNRLQREFKKTHNTQKFKSNGIAKGAVQS